MTKRGFPFGLTITVLVALSILIGLGIWQLQRLKWKEGEIAKREAAKTATPIPLVPALLAAKGPEALHGVRVVVDCPGLAQAPYEELYGLAEGQMVNRLVSPCPLEAAPFAAILVDRGYVLQTISARPAVIAGDTHPARVVGVLMSPTVVSRGGANSIVFNEPPVPPGGRKLWVGRDLPGMAKALGVDAPAPYFLNAETSTNPDWQALMPGAPPMVMSNNHLQYAFTWFALAGVLMAIYAAMLVKRFKA